MDSESVTNATPKKGKSRLTEKRVIDAIMQVHGMISTAAQALGVDRRTVYRWVEKHDSIKAALEDCREQTTDIAESALRRAIENGEAWAVCFYLKTQGRSRGYVERTEH